MTSNINVLRGYATPSDSDVLSEYSCFHQASLMARIPFNWTPWRAFVCPKNSINMLFRLTDGRTLHFSLGEDRLDDSHYTEVIF
jgi:hypothetical protein